MPRAFPMVLAQTGHGDKTHRPSSLAVEIMNPEPPRRIRVFSFHCALLVVVPEVARKDTSCLCAQSFIAVPIIRPLLVPLPPGFSALPQYRTCYLDSNAQGKKDRADPHVLRGNKHQHPSQNEQ